MYTKQQRIKDYQQGKELHNNIKAYKHDFQIPEGITTIEEKCFLNTWDMKSLSLPNSLLSFSKEIVNGCHNLTNISIPLNETRILLGKGIFNNINFLIDGEIFTLK